MPKIDLKAGSPNGECRNTALFLAAPYYQSLEPAETAVPNRFVCG
jgi:hypothetical protein